MSRHRDVRCMNYSEEYEGYDDVYGHSVEDDYCVSPSAEQFLFDRSKQQNIASFITEPDIMEDNEDTEEPPISTNKEDIALTEMERAKLMSCMESIKNVIGDTVPESEIKKKIIQSDFDAEIALDSVLKESSPKSVTGLSIVNKNNLELHPDAAPIKPQSSSFIIPKLSLNHQENTESANKNACFVNALESFKNLTLNNSPMKFSLSGFATNSVNSTLSSSTIESFKDTSDTVSFNSLADLTAYHLQKSSNLIDNTNFSGKTISSATNFMIPKLSIKKDNYSDLNNTEIDSPTTKININLGSNALNDRKINDSINSFETLSNMLTFSKDYTNSSSKNNSQNIESKDLILDVNGTRTPSPDPWMIDLSTALKEAASLVPNNYDHTKSKVLESTNNVILQASSQNVEISCATLPTTLNLSCLKYVKLPHTKKSVSLFGRTLCRTWKLRKPVLKSQKQHYETVKRFDFSVPYTRT